MNVFTSYPSDFRSASEVAAMEAKQPRDKNSLGQQMLKLGPYSINMEHRVMGQAAAIHEKEAELFYVIDGSGTIVTGGKLVNEKRTNEANLTGTAVEGGVSKKISKGDWVLVPENVPHQIPNVDHQITVMSLHLVGKSVRRSETTRQSRKGRSKDLKPKMILDRMWTNVLKMLMLVMSWSRTLTSPNRTTVLTTITMPRITLMVVRMTTLTTEVEQMRTSYDLF